MYKYWRFNRLLLLRKTIQPNNCWLEFSVTVHLSSYSLRNPNVSMTENAQNRTTRCAKSEAREWSYIWTSNGDYRSAIFYARFRNVACIHFKMFNSYSQAACCSIGLSAWTLKATKWSEHFGLSSAYEQFLLTSIMMLPDKSTEVQLLASFLYRKNVN